MTNPRSLLACSLVGTIALGWAAACSSTNNSTPASTSGSSSGAASGSASGSTSGSSDAGHDAGPPDAGSGALVDNMTATMGTQIALSVPTDAGETPGSYYVYSDYPASMTIGTADLADLPVSPAVTNADGSQITGELCFGGGANGLEAGVVGSYAGLGLSLAYNMSADAGPSCAKNPPVAFDASKYSGISFYIRVSSFDASTATLHFGVPDTQTADPCSVPTPACATIDAGPDSGGAAALCYDDFGSDITTYTPNTWSKVSFTWSELQQANWGAQFPGGIKQNQLIGMKWQVNGPGGDAGVQPFQFCISDIYFTP